jgi:hypothetical protein
MKIPEGKSITQTLIGTWETAAAQAGVEYGVWVEVGYEYIIPTSTAVPSQPCQTYQTITSGCSSVYSGAMPYTTTTSGSAGGISVSNNMYATIYGSTIGTYTTPPTWGTASWSNLKRIFFKWESMEFETLPELKKALKVRAFI